jgi:hypothetical protein
MCDEDEEKRTLKTCFLNEYTSIMAMVASLQHQKSSLTFTHNMKEMGERLPIICDHVWMRIRSWKFNLLWPRSWNWWRWDFQTIIIKRWEICWRNNMTQICHQRYLLPLRYACIILSLFIAEIIKNLVSLFFAINFSDSEEKRKKKCLHEVREFWLLNVMWLWCYSRQMNGEKQIMVTIHIDIKCRCWWFFVFVSPGIAAISIAHLKLMSTDYRKRKELKSF